jgi:ubiquinone/menaquinone biosynthesis C-methylase UbiE
VVAGSPGHETPDIETSSADYARRFSGKAGRYLLDVQSRAVREALADLPPGRALDVGGGHGQLVDVLTALGWSVTVQGSDAACGQNLRELHGKQRCEFVLGRFDALPFENGSFDLVLAVRLLAHLENWEGALREMCRIARSTVVVDYASTASLNALAPLMFGVKKSIEGNTRPFRSFAPKELGAAFAANGFQVTRAVKQFVLPMGLHRFAGAAAPLRMLEALSRAAGITALIGSPVILRGDRDRSAAEEIPRSASGATRETSGALRAGRSSRP